VESNLQWNLGAWGIHRVYRGILPDHHHADTPPLPFPAHPFRAFSLLARAIAEINDVPRETARVLGF